MSPCLVALLLALASAAGRAGPYEPPSLPPEPAPPEVASGECPELDLVAGRALPSELGRCSGVVVPRSVYLAAEEWVADARAVRQLYAATTLQLQVERDAVARDRDLLQAELEAVRPRWWERPGPVLAVGVVAGVGLTLGAAWGWGQVAGR